MTRDNIVICIENNSSSDTCQPTKDT